MTTSMDGRAGAHEWNEEAVQMVQEVVVQARMYMVQMNVQAW